MRKYTVMTNRTEAVILSADDRKTIEEYISKGYGIVNRIKAKQPLEMSVARILKGGETG